jgi:hypothetical protein
MIGPRSVGIVVAIVGGVCVSFVCCAVAMLAAAKDERRSQSPRRSQKP